MRNYIVQPEDDPFTLPDIKLNVENIFTHYTFKTCNSYNDLCNMKDPSTGTLMCTLDDGKIYCYIGENKTWDLIAPVNDITDTYEPKVLNIECKHCGATQFTKIKSKIYKCDYCGCNKIITGLEY